MNEKAAPTNTTAVSVVVRFGNDREYLGETLQAIRAQAPIDGPIEIIAVDNESIDGSRGIASQYADQVLTISDFKPGKAINAAISHSTGRFVVVLSSHTIPSDSHWLTHLRRSVDEPNIAGAYGAQLYNCNSRFLSKQIFDVFSTSVARFEKVDSDFWNANSIFSRRMWQQTPFNESVCELEDHFWTKQILASGLCVRFEPRALVYHYTHIDRLDRQIIPADPKSERELLAQAEADLSSLEIEWPKAMTAGMIVNCLPDSPWVHAVLPAVGRHLLHNADFDVRWRMAQALGKIHKTDSARLLVSALDDRSLYPRTEAAWSLARLGPLGVAELLANLPRLSPTARLFGALALASSGGSIGEKAGVQIVMEGLRHEDLGVRLQAAYVAGESSQAADAVNLIPALSPLLISPHPDAVRIGCWALGCYAHTDKPIDWPSIKRIARSEEDPTVRYEAVVALGRRARAIPDAPNLEILHTFLSDSAARVRYGAVQSIRLLSEAGYPVTLERSLAGDLDFGVRFEEKLLRQSSLQCREDLPAAPTRQCLRSGIGNGPQRWIT
jgi:hypothetical protein